MPATAKVQTELPLSASDLPALIILGRDHTNKPHAAWFDATEADAATSAAALMAMMALPVVSDELRAIAARLPHGKIFGGTGKAFVPFTKQSTYDELIVHVPIAQQVRPLRLVRAEAVEDEKASDSINTTAPSKDPVLSLPADWNSIVPGSVVLATVGRDDGWWEAVVQDSKPGNMWTLRWRDFPTEAAFTRQSSSLALLHTSRKPTE